MLLAYHQQHEELADSNGTGANNKVETGTFSDLVQLTRLAGGTVQVDEGVEVR